MTKLIRQLSQWILRWRFPAFPVLLGVMLASPSIFIGLQADDYFIRNTAVGAQPAGIVDVSPLETYSYLDGVPEHNFQIVDRGYMPWWTDLHCRASLGRPLTSLTQVIDFHLWPSYPALMHLHSLAWFALLIWAAATLYRRLAAHPSHSGPLWVAGLAALLFAVDDAHALPAGWLANRNALIAGFFGCLTLIAHDRWRRDGWRVGAWLAPAAFFLALLGKEEAASTAAYLLAYSLFLDRGKLSRRVRALIPCLIAGLVWLVGYHALRYGAYASGGYIDPIHNPLRFFAQVFDNAPILLLSQWAFPPADIRPAEAAWLFRIHWWIAAAVLILLARLLAPLLKRDAVARFWALGMLLSAIPVSAIFTSDRLLIFVGLGAMGVLASWLSAVGNLSPGNAVDLTRLLVSQASSLLHGRGLSRQDACGTSLKSTALLSPGPPATMTGKRVTRVVAVGFVGVHLVLAPLVLPVQAVSMKYVGEMLASLHDTLPNDVGIEHQTFVFVNSFACLADTAWVQRRIYLDEPRPARSLNLSPSCSGAAITRIDDRTLVVRPAGGYLQPDGWSGSPEEPALSVRYLSRHLDRLVRSPERPLKLGERIELTVVTIQITAMTDDNRPAEATFRFNAPLEDSSFRWLSVSWEGYVPFALPAVGETYYIPSPLDAQDAITPKMNPLT